MDPHSLLAGAEPQVEFSGKLGERYSAALVVPSTLSWLMPPEMVQLTPVAQLVGTLTQAGGGECATRLVAADQFYEADVPQAERHVRVAYQLYERGPGQLVVVVEENDLKYPPIVHNRLAQQLAEKLRAVGAETTVLVNSDKSTGVKDLEELVPPEFITGALAALVCALAPSGAGRVLVVQSEGPHGFEKHNLTVVDALVERVRQILDQPPEYVAACTRHWKLQAGSQFQGGLYL